MQDSSIGLPLPLIDQLQARLKNGSLVDQGMIGRVPPSGGAYALILYLETSISVDLPRFAQEPIAPGWYLYAGSAYGPGGLSARLTRHFRADKKSHWHIDRLTKVSNPVAAMAVPGGSECAIAAQLAKCGAFEFALAGFGASDCRRCRSHLLAWRR